MAMLTSIRDGVLIIIILLLLLLLREYSSFLYVVGSVGVLTRRQ